MNNRLTKKTPSPTTSPSRHGWERTGYFGPAPLSLRSHRREVEMRSRRPPNFDFVAEMAQQVQVRDISTPVHADPNFAQVAPSPSASHHHPPRGIWTRLHDTGVHCHGHSQAPIMGFSCPARFPAPNSGVHCPHRLPAPRFAHPKIQPTPIAHAHLQPPAINPAPIVPIYDPTALVPIRPYRVPELVRVTSNQASYDAFVLKKISENPGGWVDADGNHCQFAYPAEVFQEADTPPLDTHDSHISREAFMNENLPTFRTAPSGRKPAWARHFTEAKNENGHAKVELKIEANEPGPSRPRLTATRRLGNAQIDGWRPAAKKSREPAGLVLKLTSASKRSAQEGPAVQGPSKRPKPSELEQTPIFRSRASLKSYGPKDDANRSLEAAFEFTMPVPSSRDLVGRFIYAHQRMLATPSRSFFDHKLSL